MPKPRDIRRLAMQLLYQIDVTGELDRDYLSEAMEKPADMAGYTTAMFGMLRHAAQALDPERRPVA